VTLSDLAALGSFVSGIAVVVTLLFLLLQMRQANRNQRSMMQQARAERTMAALREFASPHFSEVVGKLVDQRNLTASELNMMLRTISGYFMSVEDSFLQYRAGTLDDAGWEADKGTVSALLQDPSTRAAWRIVRRYFSGDYLAFVDGIVARTEPALQPSLVENWKAVYREERARAYAAAGLPLSPDLQRTSLEAAP